MASKKAASAGGNASTDPASPTAAPRRAPRRRRAPRSKPARPRVLAGKARRSGERTPMSTGCHLPASAPLEKHLRARVIGQDESIDALVCSWARVLAGLRDLERPLLTTLLLGPTGVGKTETARALAEALFGSSDALTRINCEEYAHGHEVAKLLGSPPGYVGSDIEPLLSQRRIDKAHWRARQQARAAGENELLIEQVHDSDKGLHSIVLFDEVEKAHPTLWNALLGILEEGRVTLGNNKCTDLTRSIILMTSNVGSREMHNAMERRPVGFVGEANGAETGSLSDIARRAARMVFPAEFINRFDQVLVYEPLQPDHLNRIFDKFLDEIARRALENAGVPLLLKVSDEARQLVIQEGTDPALGARPLRRAMERLIVDPLSRLIASNQAVAGDVVEIEREGAKLGFYRLPREPKKVVA